MGIEAIDRSKQRSTARFSPQPRPHGFVAHAPGSFLCARPHGSCGDVASGLDALPLARYTLASVNRPRRPYRSPPLSRIMTSDACRWLAVVVLTPVLMLGAFRGTDLLAHGHDDHGLHFHASHSAGYGALAWAGHAADHGHEHPDLPSDLPPAEEGGRGEQGQVPPGVVVSLPDHEQLPTRGTDLSKTLSPVPVFILVAFVVQPSPDLGRRAGSPSGPPEGGPLDLRALSAGDRLVRTSRALLI